MSRVGIRSGVFLFLLWLGGCVGGQAHVYSESTIEKFISACVQRPDVSVPQCACVVEKSRKVLSEESFISALGAVDPPTGLAAVFKECGVRGRVTLESSARGVPGLSDVDVCVQQAIAAATGSGTAVSIEDQDRIRSRCGQ